VSKKISTPKVFAKHYFTSANPKKVAKKYFDDVPIRVGGLQDQHNSVTSRSRFAPRGAIVMWTVLFSFVFVAAVALHLAAMAQAD
jgi:hypothetical protein